MQSVQSKKKLSHLKPMILTSQTAMLNRSVKNDQQLMCSLYLMNRFLTECSSVCTERQKKNDSDIYANAKQKKDYSDIYANDQQKKDDFKIYANI